MEAIYLFLRAQVAVGTFFMKYPVLNYFASIKNLNVIFLVYI